MSTDLDFVFPDQLNLPRSSGSRRLINRPGELMAKLADSEGYESFGEMIEDRGHDSCVPGICWLCQRYTVDVEPDQLEGYCEECREGSVISCVEFALAVA